MADFIILKNADFAFTIKVKEKDSFLAQDLTHMDTASLGVFNKDDGCKKFSTALTVTDALNGLLAGNMPAVDTDLLTVDRGPKVDRYYLKSLYYGSVEITFTDATLPISVLIQDIYVAPIGVACA